MKYVRGADSQLEKHWYQNSCILWQGWVQGGIKRRKGMFALKWAQLGGSHPMWICDPIKVWKHVSISISISIQYEPWTQNSWSVCFEKDYQHQRKYMSIKMSLVARTTCRCQDDEGRDCGAGSAHFWQQPANHPSNNLGAKRRVNQGTRGSRISAADEVGPQSDADQHWSSKSWSDNKNPIIFGMGRVSHPVPGTPRSNFTKSRLFPDWSRLGCSSC